MNIARCRDLLEFIADYLDGDLPDESRRDFERHLELCESCVAYMNSYRTTIVMARRSMAWDDPSLPELPAELVDAVIASLGPGPGSPDSTG